MSGPEEWVQEGKARVKVPAAERGERGPGNKEDAAVFYNPAMATNRDLATLLMAARAEPGWRVLDGLAASGLRGLRYALESGVALDLELNDWNPVAARMLEENAQANGVAAKVTRRNLNALLHENVWDVVELDPFGSPAPFLDAATRAVKDGGLLGVTATDTTGLAGVFPRVCRRRYDAEPLHGELGHEVALRILAGAVVRQAAKHEVAFAPIFSHATDHYYRITLAARRGAQRADAALASVGHLIWCEACGHRSFSEERACPECGAAVKVAGPLWTGPMLDVATTDAMQAKVADATLARWRESRHLLNVISGEARAPPLYYDIHKVGERLKVGSPATAKVVGALSDMGRQAWSVHFNRLAIRTDASAKEMRDAVLRAAAS
ncbi:MAG: tRNA (guanine26-N2/guanine27-N2)-dimethyltransferase [Thermoplasmata archaeon]|nr:tRNA (guanine26-N2/guanine27-N2)-dimethyltransferase [Thermoplasmata archaeon]